MTGWDLTTRGARRFARQLTSAELDRAFGIVPPKHSAAPDSPLTHMLNVARRNGTPYQPRHCACRPCVLGFTHVAQVVV